MTVTLAIVADPPPLRVAGERGWGLNARVNGQLPTVRRFASTALDLLYPPRCVACGRFGAVLCGPCQANMEPATGEGRCPNCSARWEGEYNCPRCVHWDALDGGLAAFEMDGAVRRAVHALKYRWVRALVPAMAAPMRELVGGRRIDAAFAVPLHASRIRTRGFNQAELLLRELGWPPGEGTLRRSRKTRTQVGLHLRERRSNVSGAFSYTGPSLDGAHVILVDDVITTGATANELARVLKDFGARDVRVIAFARASYSGERPTD